MSEGRSTPTGKVLSRAGISASRVVTLPGTLSSNNGAAADIDALPGYEPCAIGAQKGDDIGDILGRYHSPQRMTSHGSIEYRRIGKVIRRHIRSDVAGRYRIHQNLARRQLHGPVSRQ